MPTSPTPTLSESVEPAAAPLVGIASDFRRCAYRECLVIVANRDHDAGPYCSRHNTIRKRTQSRRLGSSAPSASVEPVTR